MPGFLQVPLKKSQSVELIKPLSNHIKNTFSKETLDDNKDALAEFSQLRANAVVRVLDKHETSLEVLQRYYDQLCSMEAKLPIAEDQIRVNFTWLDAFDKGGLFGVAKCSLSSGAYERNCVLFNVGALFSQLACTQNHTSDDGLKTAAKYFQQASGIFSQLKDTVYPQLNTLPTPDLSVDSLGSLSAIMLAQAQDCFYLKASADKMKDAIVAKLAAQAADYYTDAYRTASVHTVKSMWDKEWLPILSGKQAYFGAIAEYHQALVCHEKGTYGEEVGRLQKADRLMNDAVKYGGTALDSKTMADKINRQYAQAKKDNDFIYLDKVPSQDSLAAVGRAALAKSLPVSTPMSSNFQDIFSRLVPMAVHQAMATYDSKKADLVNREVGRLRDATQALNGILASLNLPAAIEDLSGAKVPQSVLEKSATVKGKGGLATIDQLMQNLPELLQRNREVLDEAVRMMDEEERDDTQMRDHFKERWSRTPSRKLTEQLRAEGEKYRGIIDNAVKADSIVKEKYNLNRRAFDILCKSEGEIEAALPKAGASVGGEGQGAVQELRQLMQEVESLKKERESLEESFKSATLDMSSKFLSALSAEGFIDTEKISNQGLDEVYGNIQKQVDDNLQRQDRLTAQIQDANNRFVSEKHSSGAASQREQMLKELSQGYDAYIELSANLQEGTKFYNDLTTILLKFQNKCSDLVFARKTEKEDLSKDIQNKIAKGAPAPTPAVPAHIQAQDQQPQQRRQPPERPPPPRAAAPPQQPSQPQPTQPQQPYSHYQPGAPPASAPAAPYPTQPYFMPQPGYYAPPGGMAPGYGAGGYQPPPQGYPYPGAYQQPGGYMPPYGQQPPVGYSGYPYQQQQQPPSQ